MSSVAVIIIVHQKELAPLEYLSIRQCCEVLGRRDLYLVCPDDMDTTYYQRHFPMLRMTPIPSKWQRNYYEFGRLKIKPFLYRLFDDYEFVMFYEADAFVFRDELDEWMAKDFDYIGAPWFDGFYEATPESAFMGVGNGGFSLRKRDSLLRVTSSFRMMLPPRDLYHLVVTEKAKNKNKKRLIFLRWLLLGNNSHYRFNHFCYEDIFWCLYVPRRFPWFRVAPFEEAYQFSFEMRPDYLYRLNGGRLPSGAHAWWKHGNLDFWKQHIALEP